jgi:hypothetical protein
MFKWLFFIGGFYSVQLLSMVAINDLTMAQWKTVWQPVIENHCPNHGNLSFFSYEYTPAYDNTFINFFYIKTPENKKVMLKNGWLFGKNPDNFINMEIWRDHQVFIKNYNPLYFNMIHPISKKIFFSARNDENIRELYLQLPNFPKKIHYQDGDVCHKDEKIFIKNHGDTMVFAHDDGFFTFRDKKLVNGYFNDTFQWHWSWPWSSLNDKFIYNKKNQTVSILVFKDKNQYNLFYCWLDQWHSINGFLYPIPSMSSCKQFQLPSFPSAQQLIFFCFHNRHWFLSLNFTNHHQSLDLCSTFNVTKNFFNESLKPSLETKIIECLNSSSYDFLLIFNFIVCFLFQFIYHGLDMLFLYQKHFYGQNFWQQCFFQTGFYKIYFISKNLFYKNMIIFLLLNVNLCILLNFVTYYEKQAHNYNLYLSLTIVQAIHCFVQTINVLKYFYNYIKEEPFAYYERMAEETIDKIIKNDQGSPWQLSMDAPSDNPAFINFKNIKYLSDLIKISLFCHDQYWKKSQDKTQDSDKNIDKFLEEFSDHSNKSHWSDSKIINTIEWIRTLLTIKKDKKTHQLESEMGWWSAIFHPLEYKILLDYIFPRENNTIKTHWLYNENFISGGDVIFLYTVTMVNNYVALVFFINSMNG